MRLLAAARLYTNNMAGSRPVLMVDQTCDINVVNLHRLHGSLGQFRAQYESVEWLFVCQDKSMMGARLV